MNKLDSLGSLKGYLRTWEEKNLNYENSGWNY